MPKLFSGTDDVVQTVTGSSYQYSGTRPDKVASAEITLAGLVMDVTGSLLGFEEELAQVARTVVDGCKLHPRVNSIMVRLTAFAWPPGVEEVWGWKELKDVDSGMIASPRCYGRTTLFDATWEMLGAVESYGTALSKDCDTLVNAVVYVLTDGMDNESTRNSVDVANKVRETRKSEHLDSLLVVLVGLNDTECRTYLETFTRDAKLDGYISVKDVTPQSLAKLGQLISQSVSSTSQNIGSGAPSQPVALTF